MKTRVSLICAVILLILISTQVFAASNPVITIPTFTIVEVDQDNTVKIKAVNFPANDNFNVMMGAYGTLGIGGYSAGSQHSGTGTFTATYSIPAQMVGAEKIAIRLQSPTSGYYSYNWFWNNQHPGPAPAPAPAPGPGPAPAPGSPGMPPAGPGSIPLTSITGVVGDATVSASGTNFPTNDTLNVYIGAYGSKGIGGTLVTTQPTNGSGAFSATYDLPAGFHGHTMLAIRWESPSTGYYAYDWFKNVAGGGGGGAPAGTWGYPPNGKATHPLTTVTAVVQGNTVTIHGTNFTTNDSYQVLIGAYGTLGVGGTFTATQNTDGTGAFTATYNIPAGLVGADKLSIRFESSATGYYCYDWFNNTTFP
ncbi:MAG: hypothetical protein ABFS17_05980 [Chloroflexota bacterium]